MRLILLDILWFLTPIWVGTWIAHRFGRVWIKSVDHETRKTIAYYWLKTDTLLRDGGRHAPKGS